MRNVLLAAVSVLAVGCPSSSSNGGAIPLDQYMSEVYRASCSRSVKCGYYHSEAGCNAYWDYVMEQAAAALEEALVAPVNEGKLKYDGARARRCLDAMAAVPCGSVESPEDCLHIFEGQVAVGGDCMSSECVPSAYCTYSAGGATCPGTCQARVEEGGAATSAAQCVSSLVLVDGKCSKPRQAGEGCDGVNTQCASGLSCMGGTCKATPTEGQACSSTSSCSIPSYQSCVEGTCRAPAGLGGTCNNGAVFACMLDLACDTSGPVATCKERQGEGKSCASSTCELLLQCDSSSKTCVKPAQVGKSCASVGCDSAGYCDYTGKVCVARVAEGQPCTSFGQCVSGSTCTDGTCRSYYSCH